MRHLFTMAAFVWIGLAWARLNRQRVATPRAGAEVQVSGRASNVGDDLESARLVMLRLLAPDAGDARVGQLRAVVLRLGAQALGRRRGVGAQLLGHARLRGQQREATGFEDRVAHPAVHCLGRFVGQAIEAQIHVGNDDSDDFVAIVQFRKNAGWMGGVWPKPLQYRAHEFGHRGGSWGRPEVVAERIIVLGGATVQPERREAIGGSLRGDASWRQRCKPQGQNRSRVRFTTARLRQRGGWPQLTNTSTFCKTKKRLSLERDVFIRVVSVTGHIVF